MAFSESPKFTNKGKQLMAAAMAGEITLRFIGIKMGDGSITTQAVASLTDLINPVASLAISSITNGSDYITLQTDFDNTQLSTGFYWREVGVFAEDPESGEEVLYCYGNCGELAEYIAAAGEQTIKKIIAVSAIVGNAENVTAEITDSTYYSPQDPLQEKIAEEDLIPFFSTLSGKKNITFALLVDAIGALFGMSDLSAHILNMNNPHKITKAQIGLGNVENKSSATIRSEITSANVTNALGYTPPKQDTVYKHPTTAGNKHIPAGGAAGQILRWSEAGTAVWGADNNTTYGVVSTAANGLCPKRSGTTTKFLRDDGVWAVPPDTKYTHPTTAGYKHIPAGGASGQILKWLADGTAVWGKAEIQVASGSFSVNAAYGFKISLSVGFPIKAIFFPNLNYSKQESEDTPSIMLSNGGSGIVVAKNGSSSSHSLTAGFVTTDTGGTITITDIANNASGIVSYIALG